MKKLNEQIKRLKVYYSQLELARKTRMMLLLVSLIPLVCAFSVVYQISSSILQSQTGELIQANLEQSASNVENFWETCEGIIQSVYIDDFYREQMEYINRWDNSQYNDAKTNICKRLENLVSTNPSVLGIVLVGKRYDLCFYDRVTMSSQNSYCFPYEDYGNGQYLREMMKNRKINYSSLVHISNREYGAADVIYIGCPLERVESSVNERAYGYLVICIKEEALREMYAKGNTQSNVTMIVNGYGDLLSISNGNASIVNLPEKTGVVEEETIQRFRENNQMNGIGQKRLENAALQYIKEQEYLKNKHLQVSSIQLKERNGYVINVQDTDYAMRNFRYMVAIVLVVCVLVGLICLIFTLNFSRQVDASVKPILRAMDKANHGDMKARIKVVGHDEFARISDQFNNMMEEIDVSREQEKESLVRIKNAEIKSLEAQINPHFLYNTLDTINWVALDQKEYTISRMLTSLASILRYSIHKSNEIVEIKDEIEYLRKYVYLQQQRFDYSFICTIDVDDEILHYRIHKLMIQPLLENTLVHGFPGTTGMDEVNIRITSVSGSILQVIVEDNGVGMDQEQVDFFNRFEYQKERIESSIGVKNVITRLKLYYGEQGSFYMESKKTEEGSGTRITMRIPYEA